VQVENLHPLFNLRIVETVLPLGAAHAPSPDARYGHPAVRKPNRVSDGDRALLRRAGVAVDAESGRGF
jgi:hypothetical protein